MGGILLGGVIGLVIGGFLGVIFMAIMIMGSRSDNDLGGKQYE